MFSAFGVFLVLLILNSAFRMIRLARDTWDKEP